MDPREAYYARKMDRLEGRPEFDRSSCLLTLNLVYTYDMVEAVLSRALQHTGISLSAVNVLDVLEQQENQCAPLHEIGRLLLVSRANVTGLVDSLAKRGLVERVPHATDRRIKLARLLPAGQDFLASHQTARLRLLRDLCRAFTPEERGLLSDLLVRLRRGAQELQVRAVS